MKTQTEPWKWLLGGALAGAVSLVAWSAAVPETKAVKLERSHVEAVDFTNLTFTVSQKDASLVVRYTSESRFFLYGKPAIAKDVEVGDHVYGSLRQPPEGDPEAVRIHIEKLSAK